MPDADDLYFDALQLYKKGDLNASAQTLQQIIDSDSRFEDAYEALSVILYNQKKYDEAIVILKKWVAVNADALMAHTNLSRCYVAKNMIAEAEAEQAEARRLTWKAELQAKKLPMPKFDFEEQIARFKKVIEIDPADVLGYFSLGNAYLDAGKKRDAMETFTKAVEVDPQHSASFYGLGMAHEALGDFKKAREVYERGIRAAEARGDMMTQRKMEARVRGLESKNP